MKLFSLILISVVCCFLSSCDDQYIDVTVKSGVVEGPNANCPVYITLNDNLGFPSPMILLHSDWQSYFQSDQEDVFSIETTMNGRIYAHIRITLDCYGRGYKNWFLKTVILRDKGTVFYQVYDYNKFLNATMEQPTINVVIKHKLPTTDYKVIVETGNQKDAGTHGKVCITLTGSERYSDRILLNPGGKPVFQRGQTDTFYISTDDVGDVSEIQIDLDNTLESHSPNWFLKAVSLEDLTHKFDQWFPWNQWLTPTPDQKTISVQIPLSNDREKQ